MVSWCSQTPRWHASGPRAPQKKILYGTLLNGALGFVQTCMAICRQFCGFTPVCMVSDFTIRKFQATPQHPYGCPLRFQWRQREWPHAVSRAIVSTYVFALLYLSGFMWVKSLGIASLNLPSSIPSASLRNSWITSHQISEAQCKLRRQRIGKSQASMCSFKIGSLANYLIIGIGLGCQPATSKQKPFVTKYPPHHLKRSLSKLASTLGLFSFVSLASSPLNPLMEFWDGHLCLDLASFLLLLSLFLVPHVQIQATPAQLFRLPLASQRHFLRFPPLNPAPFLPRLNWAGYPDPGYDHGLFHPFLFHFFLFLLPFPVIPWGHQKGQIQPQARKTGQLLEVSFGPADAWLDR